MMEASLRSPALVLEERFALTEPWAKAGGGGGS